jgi:protein-tyrosine phosphatase
VPDPYYGGPDGFDEALAMVESSCRGLLGWLQDEILATS